MAMRGRMALPERWMSWAGAALGERVEEAAPHRGQELARGHLREGDVPMFG